MQATLIYNPVSGNDPSGKKIRTVRRILEGAGISHRFKETRKPRDGTRLAREAVAAGSGLVIAAGGDGTANEAVNALVGTEATLALIPLGTGNLAAHEFGIPLDPAEAARRIPTARTSRVDIGKANDRYFLMMASLGLDAQALRDAPKWAYRFLRWWAFYVMGVLSLLASKPFSVYLETGKETMGIKTRLLVISNIKGYGLPGCRFLSCADAADGVLDLGFFRSQSRLSYLRGFGQLGKRRPVEDRFLHHRRITAVQIQTDIPIPVQLDGDFYGYTPLEISVVPGGLSLLTGEGFGSG